MNAMALCNDQFEDRYEYAAQMYTDIAINAFNLGYMNVAKIFLSFVRNQNILELRLNCLLDLLESLDERFLENNYTEDPSGKIEHLYRISHVCLNYCSNTLFHGRPDTARHLLKAERLRLIGESKELLKLIKNKKVKDKSYENVGKIELDPGKFLTLTLVNCDDLETIEEIFIKSKDLFPDYDFGPFEEILEEKQKRKKKNATYSFNSNNLNVNNIDDAEKLLEKARTCLSDRKLDRAKKLVEKAERMHKTRSGAALLKQVMNEISKQTNGENQHNSGENQHNSGENQHNSGENQHNPDENQNKIDKSRSNFLSLVRPKTDLSIKLKMQELISEIQRIKEAKDDYEILKVSKQSSDEEQIKELKQMFRYHSKELHPDRIRAFNDRNPEARVDANAANEAYMRATSAKTRLEKTLKKNMKK